MKKMPRHWTELEDKIIRENFDRIDKKEVVELLPKRTWGAIRARAYIFGLIIPEKRMINYKLPLDRLQELNIPEGHKYWLAAAIDGEGTFGMVNTYRYRKRFYTPYFAIGNTKIEFVDAFKERALYNHTKIHEKEIGYTNKYYRLTTQDMGYIYSLARCLEKYLIIKKKQAALLMEFIEIENEQIKKAGWRGRVIYTPRQEEIFKTIREINKRGHKIENSMDTRL